MLKSNVLNFRGVTLLRCDLYPEKYGIHSMAISSSLTVKSISRRCSSLLKNCILRELARYACARAHQLNLCPLALDIYMNIYIVEMSMKYRMEDFELHIPRFFG